MMNEHENPNDTRQWNDEPSLAGLVKPLRIRLTETTEGWKVELSSLSPGDAMMALAREDLLEDSTILCGTGAKDWVACINGPVEVSDADAILNEVNNSDLPLVADFRMQSVITATEHEGVSAHVRDYDEALLLIASALAQYVGSIMKASVSLPDLGLVDALLEQSDLLSIKPIETEVYSTFIDIGISASDGSVPASMAAIYDIYSDSWHCD
ncbi:MAG: hypothetical protein CMJ38_05300 [Phycisphaerae bacterium]|nr:hypothetical protein [Phycisphaerae bacterium]